MFNRQSNTASFPTPDNNDPANTEAISVAYIMKDRKMKLQPTFHKYLMQEDFGESTDKSGN